MDGIKALERPAMDRATKTLVAEGRARADEANAPCYLETNEERNLAFYERPGFKVVETAPLGKDGPPGWGMRREPSRSS